VQVTAEEGASVAATNRIVMKLEDLIRQRPEVKGMFTSIGQGNPQIYYNVFQGDEKANVAEIFVCLKSFDPKSTPVMIESLRREADLIPGAKIVFKEFENGPPIAAPIEVRVVGEDLGELSRLAGEVEALLRSTPGTRNVDNPARVRRTDLEAKFDQDQLAVLGLTEATAEQALRVAFAGLDAGKFRESNGDERTIRVVLPQNGRATLGTWNDAQVPTGQGAYTPLTQIADLELSGSPALVERRNRERLVTVSAYSQTGFNTDSITRQVRTKLDALQLPSGYRWEFGGEVESRQESFSGFGGAILLAVFGILAILVLEFKSFRGTLIVASVIPLGIIGGLIGLWWTGYTLSFMSMIGFVALIGIEIKNSILLVDFTNQLRAEGVPLDEAIERAGETRFLPVVLTTLTALGALIPLATAGFRALLSIGDRHHWRFDQFPAALPSGHSGALPGVPSWRRRGSIDDAMNRILPIWPLLAVLTGLYGLQSAWVAIIGYHAGSVAGLFLRPSALQKLRAGFHPAWAGSAIPLGIGTFLVVRWLLPSVIGIEAKALWLWNAGTVIGNGLERSVSGRVRRLFCDGSSRARGSGLARRPCRGAGTEGALRSRLLVRDLPRAGAALRLSRSLAPGGDQFRGAGFVIGLVAPDRQANRRASIRHPAARGGGCGDFGGGLLGGSAA